jgi:putative Mg2+ transporter-C (MgtC) family protein
VLRAALSALPTLSWWEVLVRLALASVLGGAIGLERELREREAGLRTHLLVALGSALFTLVSAYAFRDFEFSRVGGVTFDPSRIAAQIVTGIGFLGAGAIIRQGLAVRGLTTAASLWVVAAIGMASGAGYYTAAAIATVLVIATLWPLRILAYRVFVRIRPDSGRLLVQLPAGTSPGAVVDEVERRGGRIESLEISAEGDRRNLDIDVVLPPDRPAATVVAALADLEGVLEVRWTD